MMFPLANTLSSKRYRRGKGTASGGGSTPAWITTNLTSTFQWAQIPNTKIQSAQVGYTAPGGGASTKAFIMSYSGAAKTPTRHEVNGGGHADYGGNEWVYIDYGQDTPVPTLRRIPSSSVTADAAYNPDGRPNSRHTGWSPQWIAARQKLLLVTGWGLWGTGNSSTTNIDGFDPATNDWESSGTYPACPLTHGNGNLPISIAKDSSENVWLQNTQGELGIWQQSTNTWLDRGSKSVMDNSTPFCWDPSQSRMVRFTRSFAAHYNFAGTETTFSFTGAGAAAAIGNITGACSVEWCDDIGQFLIMPFGDPASIYRCTSSFAVTQQTMTGSAPPSAPGDGTANVAGRFAYFPTLHVCCYIRSTSEDVWAFRTQ